MFHNFHLSESSFTCPGFRAMRLAQRLQKMLLSEGQTRQWPNQKVSELYTSRCHVLFKSLMDCCSHDRMVVDLQLLVQSVPITTKVVRSNPTHSKVYLMQHYVIKFVSDLRQVCGFLRVMRYN